MSKISAIQAKELIGKKVLVTVDQWFIAPDGRYYRAVFGTLVAVQQSEEALGIKVSARSQDWYMTVGNMKIAGCQIHYAIMTNDCHRGPAWDFSTGADKAPFEFQRPSVIFFADEVV